MNKGFQNEPSTIRISWQPVGKSKRFYGLAAQPERSHAKVRGGYQVGIMPDGYNKVTFRPDKTKRAALQDVQVFKTEKAARKHMDKLLAGA